MSHSSGTIKDAATGAVLGYFEYNGTVDIVLPRVHNTLDEVCDHWREHDPFRHQCACEGDVEIDIVVGEFDLKISGKMCSTHRCVTDYKRPYED